MEACYEIGVYVNLRFTIVAVRLKLVEVHMTNIPWNSQTANTKARFRNAKIIKKSRIWRHTDEEKTMSEKDQNIFKKKCDSDSLGLEKEEIWKLCRKRPEVVSSAK